MRDISLLIDQLQTLLNDSRRLPMTSGAVVDKDECLLIIDQMQVAIPQQIAEARRILEERDEIIARAEQQARMIFERAQEEAESLVDERGLVEEARARSAAIDEEAKRDAEKTMRGADEYAIRVLGELEDQLIALQSTIRNGLEVLQQDGRMARLASEVDPGDVPAERDYETK
jgi:cell division septum initiation protein DivIVA